MREVGGLAVIRAHERSMLRVFRPEQVGIDKNIATLLCHFLLCLRCDATFA